MANVIRKPLTLPSMAAAAAFIAGILIGNAWNVPLPYLAVSIPAGIILLVIFRRKAWPGNSIALALLAMTGIFAATVQQAVERPAALPEHIINHEIRAAGTVASLPVTSGGRTTFLLDCRYINHDGSIIPVHGVLPCGIYCQSSPLDEGDRIIVHGRIRKSLTPVLPSVISTIKYAYRPRNGYRLTGTPGVHPVEHVKEGLSPFGTIRRSVAALIDRYRFNGYGGLVKAMIIGDRSGLTRDMRGSFSEAGIAHVLAVSGLHAGILLAALYWLLILAGLYPRHRFVILTVLLTAYAGICGFRAPVTRTALMAVMVMGGTLVQRPRNTENTVFIVLLAMAACDPKAIFGPSLQLSFAAVWAISTFIPPLIRHIGDMAPGTGIAARARRKLLSLAGMSLVAYVATAPMAAWHFGSLPLLSIPVNIVAVPFAGLLVIMGLASIPLIALGETAAPIAAIWTTLTGSVATVLDFLASQVASLPFASIDVSSGALFAGSAVTMWLYVLSRQSGRPPFRKLLVYIPLFSILVLTWHPLFSSAGSGKDAGSIMFLDVGQGDSALIETSSGQRFLIDTGTAHAAWSVVLPSLGNLAIDHLDGLFLSHMHDDHTGGLPDILRDIAVDNIYCPAENTDSLAAIYGDRITGLAAGDSIAFPGGGFSVLSPPARTACTGSIWHEENDRSLLVRCSLDTGTVLFTGDISGQTQTFLGIWDTALRSTVLKAPHHGAGNLSRTFIGLVNPDLTVISCGLNNRYGHPDSVTLGRIRQSGSEVWRTDRDGSLQVTVPSLRMIPQ